jgi:hypothetical protein
MSKRIMMVMFCDNKSLNKRIRKRRTTRIMVNQHNYADVDLELQIILEINLLREEEIDVATRYVQSNKKKIPWNTILTFTRKTMNMITDSLCIGVKECLDHTYHKLPANKVNFVLNNHTINANVAKGTTIAYRSISLWNCMKDK